MQGEQQQTRKQVPTCTQALALVKASDAYSRFQLIQVARLHRCTSMSVRPDGTVVYSMEVADPAGGLYSLMFAVARSLDRIDPSMPLNMQSIGQVATAEPATAKPATTKPAKKTTTAKPKKTTKKRPAVVVEKMQAAPASAVKTCSDSACGATNPRSCCFAGPPASAGAKAGDGEGWDGLVSAGGVASGAAPWAACQD